MIRNCTNSYFNARKRPCLEYQIKRCKAPCVGMVSREEYLDDVNSALLFLSGENAQVQEMLVSKMEKAAEELNFEQAAFYRDRITMVSEMQARQAVFRLEGGGCLCRRSQGGRDEHPCADRSRRQSAGR